MRPNTTNYAKFLDYLKVLLYCLNSRFCCNIPQRNNWRHEGNFSVTKSDLLERYADVKEVSKRLNVHPESVRRLVRQGKLPAIKFGNKWLVEKATLEQFASRYDPRPGNKATLL